MVDEQVNQLPAREKRLLAVDGHALVNLASAVRVRTSSHLSGRISGCGEVLLTWADLAFHTFDADILISTVTLAPTHVVPNGTSSRTISIRELLLVTLGTEFHLLTAASALPDVRGLTSPLDSGVGGVVAVAAAGVNTENTHHRLPVTAVVLDLPIPTITTHLVLVHPPADEVSTLVSDSAVNEIVRILAEKDVVEPHRVGDVLRPPSGSTSAVEIPSRAVKRPAVMSLCSCVALFDSGSDSLLKFVRDHRSCSVV